MSKTSIINIPYIFVIKNQFHDNFIYKKLSELGFNHNIIENIKNNSYLDFFTINGIDLNREYIDDIVSFIEDNYNEKEKCKLLIIYNFNQTKKNIQNMLLKSIEEHKNVNIFLLTNSLDNILDTIKSRCIIEIINNVDNSNNININDNFWIKYIDILIEKFIQYKNFDIFLSSEKNYECKEIINFFLTFNNNIHNIKNMLDLFKKQDYFYIDLILKCLLKKNNDLNKQNLLNHMINNIYINNNKTLLFANLLNIFKD